MDSTPNRYEGMPFYKLFLRCALFCGVFCIVSFLAILITSLAFYNSTDPTSRLQIAGYASLYLSTFVTSFIMTRANGEKWLFGGLILGAMIFVLTLFLSIFVNDSANPQSIIFRALIIVVSLASAFLARKRSTKKSKFKHKI